LSNRLIIGAAFHTDGTLADGGKHVGGSEFAGDSIGETKPGQSGYSQDQSVVLTFIELSQSCFDVAANFFEDQVAAKIA
jgi:hypothetical protein